MPVPMPTEGVRHFLMLRQFSAPQVRELLRMSHSMFRKVKSGERFRPLEGKSMAMIFQKRSTRTRVSTEAGMAYLGGHALFLGKDDIQLGVNETMRDTAEVLGRLCDLTLARVFSHKDVEELAKYSQSPVINALSDKYHPLQALADVMTIQQTFPEFPRHNGRNLSVAWVGDGNNVVNSLLMSCPKLGVDVRVATPAGRYEIKDDIKAAANEDAAGSGAQVLFTNDPKEAVEGADVVVTDTWVSMGDEGEKAQRLKDFTGYQVTEELCRHAAPHWKFMHCLPRKPDEVSDEVFYSSRSLVFPEAENRKYTVMAVMCYLLGVNVP